LSAIRIHLDEDADAHALLSALRQRGLPVTSSRERGLAGHSDEEQLEWSTQQGCVIYTYNACDFCRLHAAFLQQGRHHSGIIIGDQQAVSIGEEMRRLLRISDARTAPEMEDRLEFLSNWA
jgi:hypothetical protein